MLVSIIVPVYDSEEYLERCLESCFRQDFTDLELIVVDDGSTDRSYEIASDLADKDSRLHLYHQDNSGASAARNKGLEVATGDYIMFVDSDDTIDEGMISSMLKVLKNHNEVDVIQTKVPSDFKSRNADRIYSGEESVRCLLEGSWWGPYCKLIRRSSISNLRFPDKTISEDYLFNYMLFSQIDFLYYINKCYYYRTERKGSLSRISLSKRKFDEFYNVKAVSDSVAMTCPQNKSFADRHLAGTCLKLLMLVSRNNSWGDYKEELSDIMGCVRSNYFSFMKNPVIPWRERLLLSSCFSKASVGIAERLYHGMR